MKAARFVAMWCIASALAAIVYVAFSDEPWPLPFAALMLVLAMIIGVGEMLMDARELRDFHKEWNELRQKTRGPRDGR